jgi:MOSC domain-containing protein YiiM
MPVQEVSEVVLIAGRGIAGDRYASGAGTFSTWPKDHELTLIEAEVLENVESEHGLTFAPGELRRNIITREVRLNGLVGKRFNIGQAVCEGTRLCEPCAHLERFLNRPGLTRLFAGRGGLRAIIIEGGPVRVGDSIAVVEWKPEL